MAKLNTHTKAAACVALAALALTAGASEARAKYEIIRLTMPDPNCNFSRASSINNNGVVVGICGETTGDSRPQIIWKKYFLYNDGIYKELNLEEDYENFVINDWGEILGGVNVKCAIYKINEKIELGDGYVDLNNKGQAVSYHGYFYRNVECAAKLYIYLHAALPILCSRIESYEKDFEQHDIMYWVDWDQIDSFRSAIEKIMKENVADFIQRKNRCLKVSERMVWEYQEDKLINLYKAIRGRS